MICPYCENPVSIEQPGCCGEVHAMEECYICEGTQPPLVAMPDGNFVHLDCMVERAEEYEPCPGYREP